MSHRIRKQSGPIPDRGQGLRLSWVDVAALIIATGASFAGQRLGGLAGLEHLPLITLGHFLIFCNMVRARRPHELVWSALWLLNLGWHLRVDVLDWPRVLLFQTPVTALVVILTIRSRGYRGFRPGGPGPESDDAIHPAAAPKQPDRDHGL